MQLSGFRQLFGIYVYAFQWVRRDIRNILIAGGLSLVLSVAGGLATFSFLPVFNIIFDSDVMVSVGRGASETGFWNNVNQIFLWAAGGGDQFTRLVRLIGFIVALSFITLLLTLFTDYLFVQIQARGTERLRRKTFEHLCGLPLTFYNKTKTGSLISRVENDIGGTIAMVTGTISDLVMNIFMAIVLIGVLVAIQPLLTAIILPVLLLISAALFWLGRWVQHNRRRILELQADLVALMQEFFGGIRIIKGLAAEAFEETRWRKSVAYWRHLEVVNSLNKAIPMRVSEFVALLLSAAILVAGGQMVITEQMPVSELLLFFIVLVRFQRPASNLSRIWLHVQDGAAYAFRTRDLLNEPTEPILGEAKAGPLQYAIEFESVSFAHGEEPILNNVSFQLKKGEVVALVGASGSGKSTIADLLIRFYEPIAGSIKIDGTPIQSIPIRDYRRLFGIVTQDTILFHDTVRNNIAYALDSSVVSEERVVGAAKAANAHEFIAKLPHGYDTVIGDRGVRLSGGQRQRLAIARALIRNPHILILDEATSALDTRSEKIVQEAIERVIQNRTTLVIAHRLSTIQKADQILVVHEGRIQERGNHRALLKAGGMYHHLWQLQSA